MDEVNCKLNREDVRRLKEMVHIRGFKSKAEAIKTLLREEYEKIRSG